MKKQPAPAAPAALSNAQHTALDRLAAGDALADVATAANVAPPVLLDWLANDARFIAALNARRLASWEQTATRARALLGKALDVITDTLDNPAVERRDKLAAAAMVLKAAGLDALGKPAGATDWREIEADKQLDNVLLDARL